MGLLLFDKSHRGTKGAELLQTGHVDAVIVRITYLGRARYHDNLLGMQAVEYLEDALPQRRTADYRVVNNHKIVFVGT